MTAKGKFIDMDTVEDASCAPPTHDASRGAWHGDPFLRDAVLRSMEAHVAADAIISDTYVVADDSAPGGYRGCFYGCAVAELVPKAQWSGTDWYGVAARELGLPERFGCLVEGVFGGLREEQRGQFAVDVVKDAAPGVDLDAVTHRILYALLVDPDGGVIRHAKEGSAQRAAIEAVAGLYQRLICGVPVSGEEWSAARAAAWDMCGAPAGVAYVAAHPSDVVEVPADAADAAADMAYAIAGRARVAAPATGDDIMYAAVSAAYEARSWQAGLIVRCLRDAAAQLAGDLDGSTEHGDPCTVSV